MRCHWSSSAFSGSSCSSGPWSCTTATIPPRLAHTVRSAPSAPWPGPPHLHRRGWHRPRLRRRGRNRLPRLPGCGQPRVRRRAQHGLLRPQPVRRPQAGDPLGPPRRNRAGARCRRRLADLTVSDTTLGYFLAVYAGFFLYMGATDLLPAAHGHGHGHQDRGTAAGGADGGRLRRNLPGHAGRWPQPRNCGGAPPRDASGGRGPEHRGDSQPGGYSHSIVAGGFEEMSSATRLTSRTSLMIRPETRSSRS